MCNDGDRIKFVTSYGVVFGTLRKGQIKKGSVTITPPEGAIHVEFDSENSDILSRRYMHSRTGTYWLESGWVEVDIDDDFYGCPEYKAEIVDA